VLRVSARIASKAATRRRHSVRAEATVRISRTPVFERLSPANEPVSVWIVARDAEDTKRRLLEAAADAFALRRIAGARRS